MTTDFRELLKQPSDNFKRPSALAAGSYHGVIKGHEFGESSQKKTPYVRYFVVPTGGIDVDTTGVDMSKRQLRKDFFLTEDAIYRLKEFLNSVGVQTAGRPLGECIPEATDAAVVIDVTQRTSQDGEDTFNDINKIKGQ